MTIHWLYECDICGEFHPLGFDGDCRQDGQRFSSPEDYAEHIGVMLEDVDVWDSK